MLTSSSCGRENGRISNCCPITLQLSPTHTATVAQSHTNQAILAHQSGNTCSSECKWHRLHTLLRKLCSYKTTSRHSHLKSVLAKMPARLHSRAYHPDTQHDKRCKRFLPLTLACTRPSATNMVIAGCKRQKTLAPRNILTHSAKLTKGVSSASDKKTLTPPQPPDKQCVARDWCKQIRKV